MDLEENDEVAFAEKEDTTASEGLVTEAQLKSELESTKEELRKSKQQAEANFTKVKYLMADFDNYRKQMDKQLASKVESNKAELLLKFVNVRDDYVRALEVAKQKKVDSVVVEGLEGILKNIDSLLSSEGVVEIEAAGTPFDPNVHDAIAFSQREDVSENTVTAELRKGYMHKDKVLRPTIVEVSRQPTKPE